MSEENAPQTFAELGLSEDTLAAIEALGWTEPTPIQKKTIPFGMKGADVVGIAQTGTGKTGAFMIPTLERIKAGGGLQVLVLAPTRELAQQVCEDTQALATGTNLRVAAIYGGVKYGPQLTALEQGFEIIAATPGRFIDHMQRGNAKVDQVQFFILDEADRMLDMGFRPQIEDVMRKLKKDRQTLLFSATMPHGVHDLALRLTRDAEWIEATPPGTTADGITELVYSVKPEKKSELLLQLLAEDGWDQVLIFSRTKRGADKLEKVLEREGIKTAVMHSDRGMKERQGSLEKFAAGKARVLVATDVAQRGLDVDGITHVVNYDVPLDPEDYVHRIGRTGRAGASGVGVTFLAAGDLGHLKTLEHHLGRTIERVHLEEFDYAGGRPVEAGKPKKKQRSHGMGTKKADELSPEELAALLNFDN